MGVLLQNDEKSIVMGYLSFSFIRQEVAKSYDKRIGELYLKLYSPFFQGYSDEENKYFDDNLPKYLNIFLFHSDCDGYFSKTNVKNIYKELVKLKPKFNNENTEKKYKELLELFKEGKRIDLF